MDLNAYLDPATIQKIQTGGYVVMFWLMVIEWPVVTLIASFLASLGIFSFPVVLVLWWAGDLIGDLTYFCIGRFGTRAFQKIQKQDAGKHSDMLHKLDSMVRSNLFLSIFVVKFTPYVQPLGLTYIGKLNTPIRKYALYSLLLCVPIPLAFGMVGYHMGRINIILQWHSKENVFLVLTGALCTIIACVTFGWYLIGKSKKALRSPTAKKI